MILVAEILGYISFLASLGMIFSGVMLFVGALRYEDDAD